jgi:hypothetical protein
MFVVQYEWKEIKKKSFISKSNQYYCARQFEKGYPSFIGDNEAVIVINAEIKQRNVIWKIMQAPQAAFRICVGVWRRFSRVVLV